MGEGRLTGFTVEYVFSQHGKKLDVLHTITGSLLLLRPDLGRAMPYDARRYRIALAVERMTPRTQ